MRQRANHATTAVIGIMLLAAILFCSPASGQTWPDKPITIYCGYAAGASTDVSARSIASGMEKLLGVPVVVENKPGGSTTVAAGLVASKKPDGYSLGSISEGALTVNPHLQKLAYDPLTDFTYLSYYAHYLGVVVVHKDSPIKSMEELIARAKANPGLSYSSTGMYTRQHLALERFIECKGLSFRHIPTKGASEASNILLGKHCDFSIGSSQIIYVKQGMFRLLMLVTAGKAEPPVSQHSDSQGFRLSGRSSRWACLGCTERASDGHFQEIGRGHQESNRRGFLPKGAGQLRCPLRLQGSGGAGEENPRGLRHIQGFPE